jgi:hypothetical protein
MAGRRGGALFGYTAPNGAFGSFRKSNRFQAGEVTMKRLIAAFGMLFLPVLALAQGQTLGATMDVYVFPASGQEASQQSMDEAECYEWATANTGTDPFDLSKQAQADEAQAEQEMAAAENAGQGAGARGAVRGAAAGALIGEIANDDASEGAAWGAAAGAVRGRRSARRAQHEAQAQASAQAEEREAATEQQLENFKKAFSVCLEAKDYMVKY